MKKIIIFSLMIFLNFELSAQSKAPGMVSSLKKMIDISGSYFEKMKGVSKTFSNKELLAADEIDFPAPYINSLILYTEAPHKALMLKNKCRLYNMMINDLLVTPEGYIERIPVKVKKKDEVITGLISRAQLLNTIAFNQCPELKEISLKFSIKNLDQTLAKEKFTKPSTMEVCLDRHAQYLKSNKTPFMCGLIARAQKENQLKEKKIKTSRTDFRTIESLNKQLKIIKALRKSMTNRVYDYYDNLCSNLHQPQQFCEKEISRNIFKDISEKKIDASPIYSLCRSMYSGTLSEEKIKSCALELSANKELCHYGAQKYPALFPKPNCEQISTALNRSRLKNYYPECPGLVGSELASNGARLYHLLSKTVPPMAPLCFLNTTGAFTEFLTKVNFMEAWKYSFCFVDPISQQESCVNSLTGNYDPSPYSEEKSLSRALSRTRGIPDNTKCKMVSLDDYDPTRLGFGDGCIIVYNSRNCYGTNCQQRIFYNKKEINHLKKQEGVELEYFANSRTRTKYSMENMLRTYFKKKTKKIGNSSQLKNFFKEHKKGIIHGLGCAEKLLPYYFQQSAMNQCTVAPFIVGGLIEKKGIYSLIVHTSMDDLATPRVLDWNQVYQSIKAYQINHTRNAWGLHGLY